MKCTTNTCIAAAMHSHGLVTICKNRKKKVKMRKHNNNPTMDDLNGLSYLDTFMCETLHLYPAVSSDLCTAGKDDCICLSKLFTDTKGIVYNEIQLAFDSFFMLLIYAELFFGT